MAENKTNQEPLSDLAYDWVTIIQHKSEALRAYDKYIQDARQANSPECVELMRQIYEQDANHVREATRHLMDVMRDGRMAGSQGQAGQGGGQTRATQGTREGGTSSGGSSQGGQGQAAARQSGMGGVNQGEAGQAAGRQGDMQQSQMEEREVQGQQQRRPRSQ